MYDETMNVERARSLTVLSPNTKRHPALPSFSCATCGQLTSTRETLEVHIAMDHLDYLPHSCGRCSFVRLPTDYAVRVHFTERHYGETPTTYVSVNDAKAYQLKRLLRKSEETTQNRLRQQLGNGVARHSDLPRLSGANHEHTASPAQRARDGFVQPISATQHYTQVIYESTGSEVSDDIEPPVSKASKDHPVKREYAQRRSNRPKNTNNSDFKDFIRKAVIPSESEMPERQEHEETESSAENRSPVIEPRRRYTLSPEKAVDVDNDPLLSAFGDNRAAKSGPKRRKTEGGYIKRADKPRPAKSVQLVQPQQEPVGTRLPEGAPLDCQECGRQTRNVSTLKIYHIWRVHLQKHRFQCNYCDVGNFYITQIRKHAADKHVSEAEPHFDCRTEELRAEYAAFAAKCFPGNEGAASDGEKRTSKRKTNAPESDEESNKEYGVDVF